MSGVIREAMIAACLTAVMILLFLGSWRSTLIIAISIPLSILSSILALAALHETINIMTLGGLALAVGILVDDATVTIENIERHHRDGACRCEEAIFEGAAQISVPALVSTLCICIVFLPMFFLNGVPRYLFVPLAEAVVFAMLASYVLSRTLVPTLAKYLLKAHGGRRRRVAVEPVGGVPARLRARVSGDCARGYSAMLAATVAHRGLFLPGFPAGLPGGVSADPVAGAGLFPDGGYRADQAAHARRRPECASRRPRGYATWWRRPCGGRFPEREMEASSTTSGCRTARSI